MDKPCSKQQRAETTIIKYLKITVFDGTQQETRKKNLSIRIKQSENTISSEIFVKCADGKEDGSQIPLSFEANSCQS